MNNIKIYPIRLAVVIITHNRIIDALINMELIKFFWSQYKILKDIDIFHIYNGNPLAYKKKYLEKTFIYRKNLGHYQGASDLIDTGMRVVFNSKKNYQYIIVMSSDVFILKPSSLVNEILKMRKNGKKLISSLWPSFEGIPKYFSTEFFIIESILAKKVFPLDLEKFFQKRFFDNLMSRLTNKLPVITVPKVELAFTNKVMSAIKSSFWRFTWRKKVKLLPGREIVWGMNRFCSPSCGYISYHDVVKKVKMINKFGLPEKALKNMRFFNKVKNQIGQ